jgi:energy-coupling factor transporter ATP-binding protein EcfA2
VALRRVTELTSAPSPSESRVPQGEGIFLEVDAVTIQRGAPPAGLPAIVAPTGGVPTYLGPYSIKGYSGEVLLLRGLNGSGKSSLALAIAGILPASSGQVLVKGNRRVLLTSSTEFIVSDLQSAVISWSMRNPEDDLAWIMSCWMKDYGSHSGAIVHGRLMDSLSHGERQWLAIHCALLQKPDLLILDEATSGLPNVLEAELFKRCRQEGCELIAISHRDPRFVEGIRFISVRPSACITEDREAQ